MEVPTMQIKSGDSYVVINVSDFDPSTMQRYEPPVEAPVMPMEATASAEETEGAEPLRRRSRGG